MDGFAGYGNNVKLIEIQNSQESNVKFRIQATWTYETC